MFRRINKRINRRINRRINKRIINEHCDNSFLLLKLQTRIAAVRNLV